MPTFTNQATLSYNNISVNSNVVTGEVPQSLYAEKTALRSTYSAGSDVTYVISLRNTGTAPDTYSLSDDLGAYTFNGTRLVPLTYVAGSIQLFINGQLQTTPVPTSTDPLALDNITIPAGGNALILYTVNTNAFAPADATGSVVNTVSVDSDGQLPTTASATITPTVAPTLAIAKAISPAILTDITDPLTYTFNITNSGAAAAEASDNASITDTFEPALNITSVTFNNTPWTEGVNYTYSSTTGEFVTIPGQLTVPAANYTQDPTTGEWIASPGASSLVVNGTFA